MTITIDGNNINGLESFYDEIENHLSIGKCPWGRNLDSLDEITGCYFNYTDNPKFDVKEIVWLNAQTSKEKLGESETIKWLTKKLHSHSDQKYRDDYKKRVEGVKNGNEQTLFELLIEIFQRNTDIKLILK